MSTGRNFLLVLLGAALVAAAMSVFTVDERQLAIKFRFGEIIQTEYEPGLHFKVPFINNVLKFDKRILTLDNRPERFLTVEKKNVIVDFFVKWRITDATKFYVATRGNEATTAQRLAGNHQGQHSRRVCASARWLKWYLQSARRCLTT